MLHLNLTLTVDAASVASIELKETVEDNREKYRSQNYTYVPLPLDGQYYNTESDSFHELDDDQFVLEDATLVNTLKRLESHPFILIDGPRVIHIEDGELKYDYASNIPIEDIKSEGTKENAFLARPKNAVEERPDLREEIFEICSKNSHYKFFNLADVNKRQTGEVLYPLIAEVETRLAQVIINSGLEPSEIYNDLSDRTIGRWEMSKYDGIETHFSEHMSLSEILKVIAKRENLYTEFGFDSRSQFDKVTGGLVSLRNAVMHPTKPIVRDRSDLEKLLDRMERAISIIEDHGGEVYFGAHPDVEFGRLDF